MNINFKNIRIQNFLSLGNIELQLDNKGFVLIKGVNNCPTDNATSNGVGKSSIFEALIWAICGSTSRGTKEVVNKYNPGGTKVELDFTIDKDSYKILRTKEDKEFGTNLFLYVNNENKSGKGIRDTEKILQEYLPDLNAQLLGSVVILGQGLPQRFTNNTPAGRKEVLEQLSKSDFMIQDIKDRLGKRKTELNSIIRKLEDSLLENNTKLKMVQNLIFKYKQDLENLQDPKSFNIQESEEKRAELIISSGLLEKELQELFILIEDNKNKHLDLVRAETNQRNSIINEFKDVLQNMNDSISEEKANINSLNKEIVRLKNIKDTCPTCGQKLPDVHKIDTTEMEQELELRESTLKNLTENLSNKTKEQEDKLNQVKLQNESEQKEVVNIINNSMQTQTGKQLELDKIKNEIKLLDSNILTYKLNLEQYENNRKTLVNNIALQEQQEKEINQNILYYNIDKDKENTQLNIVNKMIIIANRDFRGFLLSNIIEFISTKSKEYSKLIFGTDLIDFKLDGNNIFIGYCEKSYEALSGGEKQKVDLIVQFALRDMLSQFLNFTSNILGLDEIFDALDYYSCQRVLDFISNRFNDISSIYIITHHEDELDIPYDEEITITKNEKGISGI